jgi:hypothetical protein
MRGTWGALVLLLLGAATVQAQGEADPRLIPSPGWMTPDSLARAVGLTDSAALEQIAPHLEAIQLALTRGRNDPALGEVYQQRIDAHLVQIRQLLPEENRAAFDRLQKPRTGQILPVERGAGPPGQAGA